MSTVQSEKKVKKTSSKSKKEIVVAEPQLVAEAASAEPIKKEKKEKKEKKLPSPKEIPAAEAPVEEAPAAAEAEGDAAASEEKLSRKKRTYAQLLSEVDSLNDLVERYIIDHRDTTKNTDLNRFLKGLEKGLRKVRVHAQKIGKNRSAASSGNSVQSGFQKPVRISNEVAQFTGWSTDEPRARVDVTNFVCDYIKQNNLQSPEDRRVILADARLQKLLDYQNERDGKLTYATIQKLLAKHYTPLASA